MAVRRGLIEALVLYVLGAVIAVVAASVWTLVDDGDFRWRFGALLAGAGLLLTLTGGGLQMSRMETLHTRAFLGAHPEREEMAGARTLTGLGVFFFVSVPLIATGLVLIS